MLKNIFALVLLTSIVTFAVENPIVLKIGQTKKIELPSNPTTGYLWEVNPSLDSEGAVEVMEDGFEMQSNLIGASGNQFWIFKAKNQGNTQVTFEYKQPWTSIPATKTQTFTFQVQ